MIVSLLILAMIVGSRAAPQDLHFFQKDPATTSEDAWEEFKAEYGKTYGSVDEENRRKEIFAEKVKIIEEHNKLYDMGLQTYRMGVNRFTDMKSSEIIDKMTGRRRINNKTDSVDSSYVPPRGIRLPRAVDWRSRGFVTPVKDQNPCGSCYTFSSTGALEAQWKKKTGKLVSLSEQNLVDCSKPQGNNGCEGGFESAAYEYIIENGGIDTEEGYPYEAKEGKCRYKRKFRGATVSAYQTLRTGSEADLKTAVALIGPIAVGINAAVSFQNYKSGIYFDEACDKNDINHAVLVVGYASERNIDYWIVKNSWGSDWGAGGYIRMARNRGNLCGIASDCTYPIV